LVELWQTWRRIPSEAPTMLQNLIRASQGQSKALSLQIEFLKTGNTGGLKQHTVSTITKFRFLEDDILCELRFPDGDITLTPTSVWCLDLGTPIGKHIISHYIKVLHEEYGHSSVRHVSWLMSRIFACHGLKKLISEIINGCQHCQTRVRLLARRAAYKQQRHLDTLATSFLQYTSVDLFTIPLGKRTLGMSYVLVLIDHFSRFTLLSPLKNKTAAVVDAELTKWFDQYTLPERIRSDNEPLFKYMSKRSKFAPLWRHVAVQSPFSNGICERVMTNVRTFVNTHPNWLKNIRRLQKRLNTKQLPEGYSPVQIVFGRDFGGKKFTADVPENLDAKKLWEKRKAELEEIAIEVRRSREQRLPTREPPRSPEKPFARGDFVVRIYDEKRTPMVVDEIRSSEHIIVVHPIKMKRTLEHIRNLKQYGTFEEELASDLEPTGGTDVEETSSDSEDELE
jgi:hypothetical protein